MKMKQGLFTFGACLVLAPLAAVAAPSAKFAATWGYGPSLASVAVVAETDADAIDIDLNAGYTLATIKVPQDKELLVGVSAEVGILTDTSLKGRNGGAAKSIAGGGAAVMVVAVPTGGGDGNIAEPGPVVLAARVQELSATLGGVIDSCTDADASGTIDVASECVVTDEQIGLIQGSLSSHHFNFVLPDMDQGEYDIVAFFLTGALAAVDIDEVSVTDGGSITGAAFAAAFVGKHMVTVQQVRAVKGGLIDVEIVEL